MNGITTKQQDDNLLGIIQRQHDIIAELKNNKMTNEEPKQETPKENKAKFTLRDAGIWLNAYENEFTDKEGNTYINTSYTIKKTFKNKESDKWENTDFLNSNDILRLSNLLLEAYNKQRGAE